MFSNFLVALSENDKRILIALGILLILVFVIVGYIGLLVERIMKHQAKKAGTMMYDVVVSKVINNAKDFKKLGYKKNNRLFFKQATPAVIILFIALIVYVIYGAINSRWIFNIFDYEKYGFGTICFIWDFNDPNIYINFFGMKIIGSWPPLIHTPSFTIEAWASYIIVPALFVGGTWLLVATQAHIARYFKLRKLSKSVFNPTLDSPLFNKDLSFGEPIQNQNITPNSNNTDDKKL